MAWELYSSGSSFEWHLSARTIDRIAFGDALEQLPFYENITIYIDNKSNKTQNLETTIESASLDSHFYVCGPQGDMEYITVLATNARLPGAQLHIEHFGAEIDVDGDAFEIYALRSNLTIQVSPNETILSALTRAGIDVITSCENGVCGSCLTKVIKGKPDHRDLVLTDTEKAMNDRIALCCSRSQSKRLELDI